jgi:gluconate 2-dehydrogenase gamma chain
MNDIQDPSRRHFLQSAGSLAGGAYLRLLGPGIVAITQAACSAKQEQAPFKVLTAREASDFAAIAARIIPSTDTPGASEAGVVYFIDTAFATDARAELGDVREGLAEFNAALDEAHPDNAGFAALSEDRQDEFLKTQQSGYFFNITWAMTIFGFFSMEKYGGNKDLVGWDLIGFEGHHGGWQYPFGHYDAEVHAETNHGG